MKVVFSTSKDKGLDRLDAYDGEKNVGHLTYQQKQDEIFLCGLKVRPKYRGKGIAKALISKIISDFPGKQFALTAKPYGEKGLSIEQLIYFYSKLGFQFQMESAYMVRKPL